MQKIAKKYSKNIALNGFKFTLHHLHLSFQFSYARDDPSF